MAVVYVVDTSYGINPILNGWANVICARNGDANSRSDIIAAIGASGMRLGTFGELPWRSACITAICVCPFD